MSGRPRALDEVKRREVCALVSAGCGIDAAARYVGCNAITIRRESMRNPEFYEQLRSAELNAQLTPLQALRKAASTHWRAAAWFLERTQPNQYARREPLTVTPDDLKIWVEKVAKSLFDEVNDSAMVTRILSRLDAVAADCERNIRAGEAVRPDVHSRRRQRTKGYLTRDAETAPAPRTVAELGSVDPASPVVKGDTYPGPGPPHYVPPAKPRRNPALASANTIEQNTTPLCPS